MVDAALAFIVIGIEDSLELWHGVDLDTDFEAELLENSKIAHAGVLEIVVLHRVQQVLFLGLITADSLL